MRTLLATLFLLSVCFPNDLVAEGDALSALQQQAASSASSAAGAGEDLVASDYLQGKFKFSVDALGKPVLSTWYPFHYPTAADMNPRNSAKPRIWGPNISPASRVTQLIPRHQVFKEKKTPSGPCEPVSSKKLLYNGRDAAPTDCLTDVATFKIDPTDLASVQQLSSSGQLETDPLKDGFQRAFMGVFDMNTLSASQKNGMFTQTNPSLPKAVENIEPKPVIFRRYIAEKTNVQKMAGMEVQVGSLVIEVPIPTPNFPPVPKCEIQVDSSMTQPITLSAAGTKLKVNILADSVVRSGKVRLSDPSKFADLESGNILPYQTSTVGTFTRINKEPLEINVSTADLLNTLIVKVENPDNALEQLWTVVGDIQGVDSSVGPISCALNVRINHPLPPKCSLGPTGNLNPLPGETTPMSLDCSMGGPAEKYTVMTRVNGAIVRTNNPVNFPQNIPMSSQPRNARTASFNHPRFSQASGEEVVVSVIGPQETVTVWVPLGDVCPYNDPNFFRTEFTNGEAFREQVFPICSLRLASKQVIEPPPPTPPASEPGAEAEAQSQSESVTPAEPEFQKLAFELNCGDGGPIQAPQLTVGRMTSPTETIESTENLTVNSQRTVVFEKTRRIDDTSAFFRVRVCDDAPTCIQGQLLITAALNSVVHLQEVGAGPDATDKKVSIADISFSRGRRTYQTYGTFIRPYSAGAETQTLYFESLEASLFRAQTGSGIDRCINATGDWLGCWGDPGIEQCNSDNFCMIVMEHTNSNYNRWRTGGVTYWVEIGDHRGAANGNNGNGGKRDPSCTVLNAKMRRGGCFSGDTRVLMADGRQKRVDQIGENEWVYNPHYQAPVRIKSVVKGPEKKALYQVVINDKKIEVTEDHPFLTQRGWLQALELRAGDKLFGEGEGKQVSQVRKLPYKAPQDVWNFELDAEDPLAHVVVANGIPTGDLSTQLELKKAKKRLP